VINLLAVGITAVTFCLSLIEMDKATRWKC